MKPEGGFTSIPNSIQEVLSRTPLTGRERRILDVVFRKTYGWNKPSDKISLSQFADITGIGRRHVIEVIKTLIGMKILLKDSAEDSTSAANGTRTVRSYSVNAHCEEWGPVCLVPPKALGLVPKAVNCLVPPKAPTIEREDTKDKYVKEREKNKRLEDTFGLSQTIANPAIDDFPFDPPDQKPKSKKRSRSVKPVYSISWNEEKRNFAGITDDAMTDWKSRYPLVDVLAEIKNAREWLMDTGNRRDNYALFLAGWFRRTQDKPALHTDASAVTVKGKAYHLLLPDKSEVQKDKEVRKPNPAIAELMTKIRG